jgi:hypothetical protein
LKNRKIEAWKERKERRMVVGAISNLVLPHMSPYRKGKRTPKRFQRHQRIHELKNRGKIRLCLKVVDLSHVMTYPLHLFSFLLI